MAELRVAGQLPGRGDVEDMGKGGGKGGGKGNSGGKGRGNAGGWPSTTGKPSGGNRSNAESK